MAKWRRRISFLLSSFSKVLYYTDFLIHCTRISVLLFHRHCQQHQFCVLGGFTQGNLGHGARFEISTLLTYCTFLHDSDISK